MASASAAGPPPDGPAMRRAISDEGRRLLVSALGAGAGDAGPAMIAAGTAAGAGREGGASSSSPADPGSARGAHCGGGASSQSHAGHVAAPGDGHGEVASALAPSKAAARRQAAIRAQFARENRRAAAEAARERLEAAAKGTDDDDADGGSFRPHLALMRLDSFSLALVLQGSNGAPWVTLLKLRTVCREWRAWADQRYLSAVRVRLHIDHDLGLDQRAIAKRRRHRSAASAKGAAAAASGGGEGKEGKQDDDGGDDHGDADPPYPLVTSDGISAVHANVWHGVDLLFLITVELTCDNWARVGAVLFPNLDVTREVPATSDAGGGGDDAAARRVTYVARSTARRSLLELHAYRDWLAATYKPPPVARGGRAALSVTRGGRGAAAATRSRGGVAVTSKRASAAASSGGGAAAGATANAAAPRAAKHVAAAAVPEWPPDELLSETLSPWRYAFRQHCPGMEGFSCRATGGVMCTHCLSWFCDEHWGKHRLNRFGANHRPADPIRSVAAACDKLNKWLRVLCRPGRFEAQGVALLPFFFPDIPRPAPHRAAWDRGARVLRFPHAHKHVQSLDTVTVSFSMARHGDGTWFVDARDEDEEDDEAWEL